MGDMNVTIPVFPDGDYPNCSVLDCGGLTRKCTLVKSNQDKVWRYSRQTGDPPTTENIELECNNCGPQGWQWVVRYYFDTTGDGQIPCRGKWQTPVTQQDLSGGGSAPVLEWGSCPPNTPNASWAPAP